MSELFCCDLVDCLTVPISGVHLAKENKSLSSVKNKYTQVFVGFPKANLICYVSSLCQCSQLIDIFLTMSSCNTLQVISTV